MKRILGIDFGTTNCCMAIMEGEEPVVIPNKRGNLTTPSFFALDDEGNVLAGEVAKRQAVVNPEKTIFAIKRFLGRRYDSEEVNKLSKVLPYILAESPNGDVEIVVGKRKYSPEEVAAIILRDLKRAAEEFLNEQVQEAVITVPAYFTDSQRQATKDAGTIAGLDVQRIINEPTAAAITYGFNKEQHKKIAVYDLGGGTFDISILELGDGLFEVLSTNGDNLLGGEDFDQKIVEHVLSEFHKAHGQDLGNDNMALQRIREAAEKAKCELSEREWTELVLPFISRKGDEPLHFQLPISRDMLNQWVEGLIDQTLHACQKALDDSRLKQMDINEVILVGGQTKMPLVQQKVKEFFSREPCKGVNPDEVVAIGAALQGGIISGEVKDLILLDVVPHSMGIETDGDKVTKLILRNTSIPVRVKRIFTTMEDNQRIVKIHVLQGESSVASENVSLGQFELVGIIPAMKGVPKIEVTFDVDADGILHVSAKDLATGREQGIQVTGRGGLNQEKITEISQNINLMDKPIQDENIDLSIKNLKIIFQQAKEFLDNHEDYLLNSELEEIRVLVNKTQEIIANNDVVNAPEMEKKLKSRLLYLIASVGEIP